MNASPKTWGIAGVDIGKDWYFTNGGTQVSQDVGGTPLTSSDTLTINYFKSDDVLIIAENSADIAARAAAEITAGIHERKISNGILTGTFDLSIAAQAILDLIDEPSRTFTWEGDFDDWNTAMPGHEVTMRIGNDIGIGSPLSTIVRSIQIVEIDKGYVRKRFESVSGPILKDGFETFALLGKGGVDRNITTVMTNSGPIIPTY